MGKILKTATSCTHLIIRETNLAAVRKQFKVAPKLNNYKDESWQELLQRLTGFNVNQCPGCKIETMQSISMLQKQVPI
ncbi:MAG: hypothetical protein HRT71_21820 [Flavobacteriales bacterium]|nr:hypothetical protein [Flavobacteriales bacterium]